MAKRTRRIKDEQCGAFEADMEALKLQMLRALSTHGDFSRDEWLGGDQKADNHEVAPEACSEAMALLRQALELVVEADHKVAMFRATGDVEPPNMGYANVV